MGYLSEKRRDAFFEEFTWLNKYIPKKHRKYIEQINVSRVDKDLLGRTAFSCYVGDAFDGRDIFEQLVLLDKDGDIIKRELPPSGFNFWRLSIWKRKRFIIGRVTAPSTVAARIVSLGKEAEKIAFIFSAYANNLVIYKPPKKFDIQTLLEEVGEDKKRKAEKEEKKEAKVFNAQKQSIRKEWESLDS